MAIDQVRDLKRDAAYPPYEGRWKVFIIEDTEQMRAEAANSLLKVLEEPPARTVLILLSESTEGLLPTLVSRAQLVRFALVPTAEIMDALTARRVSAAQARYLAAVACGRVGAALDAATAGEEVLARRNEVLRMLRTVEGGDVIAGLDAADAVARQKDEIERWLDVALLWFRDLAIWQVAGDPGLLANLDRQPEVVAGAARISGERLSGIVDAIEQAKAALRRNINPRLILETLFIQMGTVPGQPAS